MGAGIHMLTFLLLGQASTSDAIIKRFNQYMAKSDHLSVSSSVKFNGRQIGTGTIKIDRPTKMRVTFKSPFGEEWFAINDLAAIEVSKSQNLYSVHPVLGRLYTPGYRITAGLQYVVPHPLIQGNSNGLFPQGAPIQVKPNVLVNGVTTDQLTAKSNGVGSEIEVMAWIDRQGRLARFSIRSQTIQGEIHTVQDLSNYSITPKFTPETFSTQIPAGTIPYALANADFGLPQGQPMPSITLRSVANNSAVSLKSLTSGKNTMVVVTDPEFPANSAMFDSIRTISSKIPNFRLVVVSAQRDLNSAKRLGIANIYYDPTGSQLAKLQVPGSPSMFLFTAKGTLAQMFFGFDGKWEGLSDALKRLK